MPSIGVTGHRVLAELEKINAGVDQALRRIEQALPDQPCTVVSALAEGADRLVVHRVLTRQPNARLVVPLPLPQTDYLTDFRSAESKDEFLQLLSRADEVVEMPRAPTRAAAYKAAGDFVLDHCDVLIAIWDGKGAQGEGGTATVVAGARQRGLPIAWIHAGNRRPGTTEPTSLGADQGKVTLENF